ncbi:MAG: pilus assembly protein TadG-related protein [Acidimicrobiales bacterium]
MLRHQRSDKGVTVIFVALLLLVFMGFAAFAVDFGTVYSARRLDQNAADAAALAGAQELINGEAAIAAAVIAYAEEDLGATGLDWNSCDDDDEALDDIVNGNNCITRDETLLRVKTPPRAVGAIFGRALGEDNYEHSAFAIAGLTPEGFGSVLPFGLFTSNNGHLCLRTDNPSTPVSPCAGSETGDSGALNLGFYGSLILGTPEEGDCNPANGGGTNGRLKNNIASGADHIVARRLNLGQGVLRDTDDCPDKSDPRPNAADTITGAGAMQGLEIGLFSGGSDQFYDNQPARLRREAQVPYADQILVEGIEADNTPLWEFIGAGTQAPTNVPDSCQRSVFTGALADVNTLPPALAAHLASSSVSVEVRMEKLLERCFAHYDVGGTWTDGGAFPAETRTGCSEPLAQACSGILFTRDSVDQEPQIYDIQLTPRFGYVPLVWELLGANTVSYKLFRPVFIQRLCIGNQACNQGTFSPGVGWTDNHGSTSTNVHAVSAFAFHPSMLPNNLGSEDAPFDINVNLFLRLVR